VSSLVAEIAAAVAARLNAERVEAGVSAAATGSAAVVRAARQARLAIDHAGRESAPSRVVVFEDLIATPSETTSFASFVRPR
jgi:hypothetical protein